jgi:hypothetical protein
LANKKSILFFLLLLGAFAFAQNNTFSPYSRYALGELNPSTFAQNQAMGGACIAYRADSTMPVFINTGNPASYALLRLTSLEVGGSYRYSQFDGGSATLKKWATNFSYATLGFPVGPKSGAVMGIMPYSHLGYDLQDVRTDNNYGSMTYLYSGTGGLTKAFMGYGMAPFNRRLVKFRKKHLYTKDSAERLSHLNYKLRENVNKLLSDFSAGFNVNYIFGSMQNTTRIIYPNSIIYNNTYRVRSVTMGDFTGNFGFQTAFTIDTAYDRKGKRDKIENIMNQLRAQNRFSKQELKAKEDSLHNAIPLVRKAMSEKIKFTFGAFVGLNNSVRVTYDAAAYNYILDGTGREVLQDTVYYNPEQKGHMNFPLERGIGIGFKKGERINVAADFAVTGWKNFKLLDNINTYKDNYRAAIGVNYVPEKTAAGTGALFRRIHYRLGANYNTGYIQLTNGATVSSYAITAGFGIPVGINRSSSMVNLAFMYGKMGPTDNSSIRENFWRISFGFTYNDRWFNKFRYD